MADRVAKISVGGTFRHSNGQLCHVRAVVEEQYVYRFWRRTKQRWDYSCEPVWLVDDFMGRR